MDQPEGLVPLADALVLLFDVRKDVASEQQVQLASNIVFVYANKLQTKFEELGARTHAIHDDILHHWIKVYNEFNDSGFEMPPRLDIVYWTMLLDKETLGKFSRLTPEKRKDFLEGLFGDKAPKDDICES